MVHCDCTDNGEDSSFAVFLHSQEGIPLHAEVTFISPCPAKGLAVVLRLALMFPGSRYLSQQNLF